MFQKFVPCLHPWGLNRTILEKAYGFVKLQCYTASHGFEELDTYTDSNSLFEGLWEEWLSLNVFLLAREMQLADVLYDDLFNNLPKEKQSELTGRKDYFAKKAGITL